MGKKTRINKARAAGDRRYDLSDYEAPDLSAECAEPAEVEEMLFFTAGGKEYWGPTSVPFDVALKGMDVAARDGEPASVVYQLQAVLGVDGYRALVDATGTRREAFEAVVTAVNKIIYSSVGKA
jgi:hypothetical protein